MTPRTGTLMKESKKFQKQLKNEYVYRVNLRYFTDLGKIGFPQKIDLTIKCHLETDLKKLFKSRKVLSATAGLPSPDAKIIFTKAAVIQYEQLLLDQTFRQHLEAIMVSKKILRMGAQKTPIQKTYEINIGQASINIDLLGAKIQFDWLEMSLIFDKSDKDTTIYDSSNVELAAKYTKSVKISKFTEIYSLKNETEYDIDNLTQKHLLYKQFFAWACDGCSVAPLTDYTNNPIYQELISEEQYDGNTGEERLYLDLRASSGYTNEAEKLERNGSKTNLEIVLKNATTKKLRLRIRPH